MVYMIKKDRRVIRALSVAALLVGACGAPLSVAAQPPTAAPTLTALSGYISSVTARDLTFVTDTLPPRRLTIALTGQTTYWERAQQVGPENAVPGPGAQIWVSHPAGGPYTATRVYFKVVYLSGIVQQVGPRSIVVDHGTYVHRDLGTVRIAYDKATSFREDGAVVSGRYVLAGTLVGVVGYLRRGPALHARIIQIRVTTVRGTVVGRGAGLLYVRDSAGAQVALSVSPGLSVARGALRVPQTAIVVGSTILAQGYPQLDHSLRVSHLWVATQAFSGVLTSRNGQLTLSDPRRNTYSLTIPSAAALSYRHQRPIPYAGLLSGSKVTGRAYLAPGQVLLVVSLVVWTVPGGGHRAHGR